MENEEVIKSHIENYFWALFHDDRPVRPKVDGLPFSQLGDDQTAWLERPFEEEVKKAVWMIDGDKALRPNGFTLAFYKSC